MIDYFFEDDSLGHTALINGIKVPYDLCSENIDAYDDKSWGDLEYLGAGVIWSICNVRQNSTTALHFWKYKVIINH